MTTHGASCQCGALAVSLEGDPDCGTNLYWTLEMRPEHVGVGYGNFDTKVPDPVRIIWTEEQHGWVRFPDDVLHFPNGTPEPG